MPRSLRRPLKGADDKSFLGTFEALVLEPTWAFFLPWILRRGDKASRLTQKWAQSSTRC